MMKHTLIGPFTQLLPMDGLPAKGPLRDEHLRVIEGAGIYMTQERVVAVGPYSELLPLAQREQAEIVEVPASTVALPGWIDAHTHLCWGGTRAADFARRNAGMSYLEIAQKGGGIWDTVTQTRQATEEELTESMLGRAQRHLTDGITTVEVKSGYGLSVEQELKILRAIAKASQQMPQTVVATCLAAHTMPRDYDGDRGAYLAEIGEKLLPVLKAEGLAHRVDAFIEEGAFSPQGIQPYFEQARSLGFDITVHGDQFTTGGTQVAIDFGAISVDHLEASTEVEVKALAKSNVVPVALPGATLGLGCPFTPARQLLDADCSLAIASDWNPGSAPMGDLVAQASILATFQKLTNAEVLAGMTVRAAHALGLRQSGFLAPNARADFNLYTTDDYREITYQQGRLKPSEVWKSGNRVYQTTNQG
ncbi:MAG: imidazolonepropionase [Bacteroidota bacterium]